MAAFDPPSFLIDVDGSICRYDPGVYSGRDEMEILPGVREKLIAWKAKGCHIVLTTGRGIGRERTEEQLRNAGIVYDQLVMGLGGGPRHLINDIKPDGTLTAIAHNLPRNVGFSFVDI